MLNATWVINKSRSSSRSSGSRGSISSRIRIGRRSSTLFVVLSDTGLAKL